MPWMRISIGVGCCAVLAGVAGMTLWIYDGSHFFDLAVAVALAGFLTLTASLLTRVFESSHGSQDDAFRRGMSMGYDAGFLEGHRMARPVVVPLRMVGRDPEVPADDYLSRQPSGHADDLETPLPAAPMWHRDANEGWDQWDPWDRWDRGANWVCNKRAPLLLGALALGVIGVLTASMVLPTSASTVTSGPLPGTQANRDEPSLPGTPALVAKAPFGQAPVAAITDLSRLAPAVLARVTAVPVGAGAVSVPAPSSPDGTPGAAIGAPTMVSPAMVTTAMVTPAMVGPAIGAPAIGAPAIVHPSVPASPIELPPVVPVVAAPALPLTAAQQTAVNAKAAADLTIVNAKAAADLTAADAKVAADLTAANAAAAAAETARVAAAAAEATRLQAIADAYAVAHPAS